MSIGRNMLAKFQGGFERNPLETLGFSPDILELLSAGLKEDDLYEHVRQSARRILALVHPDRHGGKDNPAVRRFSEALVLINNREIYEAALKQFREGDVYERREKRDLREKLARLSRHNSALTGRLEGEQKKTAGLLETIHVQNSWAHQFLYGLSTQFARSKKQLQFQTSIGHASYRVIAIEIEFSERPFEHLWHEARVIYERSRSLPGLRPLNKLIESMELLYLHAVPIEDLLLEAAGSEQEFKPVCWTFAQFAEENFPLLRLRRKRVLPPRNWPSELGEAYRQTLTKLARRFSQRYVTKLVVQPKEIVSCAGRIKESRGQNKLFLLGSADLDCALALLKEKECKELLLIDAERWKVIDLELNPYIFPGRAMIACHSAKFQSPVATTIQTELFVPYVALSVTRVTG